MLVERRRAVSGVWVVSGSLRSEGVHPRFISAGSASREIMAESVTCLFLGHHVQTCTYRTTFPTPNHSGQNQFPYPAFMLALYTPQFPNPHSLSMTRRYMIHPARHPARQTSGEYRCGRSTCILVSFLDWALSICCWVPGVVPLRLVSCSRHLSIPTTAMPRG